MRRGRNADGLSQRGLSAMQSRLRARPLPQKLQRASEDPDRRLMCLAHYPCAHRECFGKLACRNAI